MLASLLNDVRHSIRSLCRSPRFTSTALVVIALGVGSNTAVFSVVDNVLLRPSRYAEPDRLVIFGYTFRGSWVPFASEAKFNVWREVATTVAPIAAVRFGTADLTDPRDPQQVSAARVSAGFFPLIGAPIAAGRAFNREDDRVGREPVVILSYQLWQQRFGGRQGVVGQTLSVEGRPSTIIGIAGPGLDTRIFGVAPDVWLPLQLDPSSVEQAPSLRAIARLKPGTTFTTVNQEARRAGVEFDRRFPGVAGPNDTFAVRSLLQTMVPDIRSSLLVLVGAVLCLLLIGCANVANLMSVRTTVRQREIAIRSAMGASTARLASQLMIETLVLSLAGGVLGLASGVAAIRLLAVMDPGGVISTAALVQSDLLTIRVLLFGVLIALAAGLLSGLPSLLSLRHASDPSRMAGGARTGTTLRYERTRSLIVVMEMSLAVVLLTGAVLMIRTFVALRLVDRGFSPGQVVTMKMSLAGVRPTDAVSLARLVREGTERLEAIPGVAVAAAACCVPLESDWRTSIRLDTPSQSTREELASERIVSDGYFKALDIPIVAGRAFGPLDGPLSEPVALIDETMARRYWPTGNAVGQFVTVFPGIAPTDERPRQIIGIVRNMRDGLPLDEETRSTVFVPLTQMENALVARFAASEPLVWFVRPHPAAGGVIGLAQRQLQGLSRDRPVTAMRSLVEVVDQSTGSTRFYMAILALFAGTALLVAGVGLYAVSSYAVEQRTRELGIRAALGAEPRALRRMVLAHGMTLAITGAVSGVTLAFGVVRSLNSLLFGVTPYDPTSFVIVPLILVATAAAAVTVPARRAIAIDPVNVLRND